MLEAEGMDRLVWWKFVAFVLGCVDGNNQEYIFSVWDACGYLLSFIPTRGWNPKRVSDWLVQYERLQTSPTCHRKITPTKTIIEHK